jgi:hypothetical protein
MSLYYDAVNILTSPSPTGGSFKSRIYNERGIKANPAQIYALIIEASKWDTFLKEVIENAGILKLEPKVRFSFRSLPPVLSRTGDWARRLLSLLTDQVINLLCNIAHSTPGPTFSLRSLTRKERHRGAELTSHSTGD